MRRKLAVLLTIALTVAMLGGCGSDVQTATKHEGGSEKASETTNTKNKEEFINSGTLSDLLFENKTIMYRTSNMDKTEVPKQIYFFDNGKVTEVDGMEEGFGFTMGELSDMTDEKLWEKEEGIQKELDEELKIFPEIANNFDSFLAKVESKALDSLGTGLVDDVDEAKPLSSYISESDWEKFTQKPDCLNTLSYFGFAGVLKSALVEAGISSKLIDMFCGDLRSGSYWLGINIEECTYDEFMDKLKLRLANQAFAVDVPIFISVETDSSGNYAEKETVYYVSRYSWDDADFRDYYGYDKIEFYVAKDPYETKIYDSVYAELYNGCYIRGNVSWDTLTGDNISLDPSIDEIEEYFKK